MSSPFTFIERTRFKCAGVAAVMRALLVDLHKLARWVIHSCCKRS